MFPRVVIDLANGKDNNPYSNRLTSKIRTCKSIIPHFGRSRSLHGIFLIVTQIKSFTTKVMKSHKGKPILFVLPLIYRFSLPAPNAAQCKCRDLCARLPRVLSGVVVETLNKVINRANLKK